MTLQKSAPHGKPRWLVLLVLLMSLTVVGAGFALAHGVASVPARYAGGTQVDNYPTSPFSINDAPGQVDMTQMGRDTSVSPDVRIFWSWDSISAWTGSGQTGDACALFDTGDADAFINYVICARVSNTNADPSVTEILPASANHPVYLFVCSNKKDDRCTNPAPTSYTAGQVLAGPLTEPSSLTESGAGNLQNETDPFAAGEAYPHDTSIEIQVDDTLVPTGVDLVNVCSYPSAGNGGNNNPFDCINNPGVQYGTLVVTKAVTNDNGGTRTVGQFSFTVGSGATTTGIVAATAFTPVGSSTTSGSNSQQIAVGTYSIGEVGAPIAGYTTGYTNCTSVAVTAGNTTTCAITNNDNIASPSIASVMKWTLNDRMTLTGYRSGGTGTNTATFTLYKDAGSATNCEASTQVSGYTPEVITVNDTTGTAATATGYTTEVTGTYRWIVTYSGNTYNSGISTPCTGAGSEMTTLP